MDLNSDIDNVLRPKLIRRFDIQSLEVNSRAIIESYLSKAQQLYDIFSKQQEIKRPFHVAVSVTNSLKLDAFVCKLSKPDYYLVALSYGIFANLYACFMGLLSHPEVLTHIGDSHHTHCLFDRTEYGLLDFTYEQINV